MTTTSVNFAVVLYDGLTETDIGSVAIYPDITVLKSFQMILSHKIGISAHQFTVYLSFKDHKRPNTRPKFCRRVPITAKTDFSSLLSPNEFHPCVNDAIVFSWFKSHAGPISPPIN
ncbi:hypothetical protein ACFE04_021426 [Oxalis oulophora]